MTITGDGLAVCFATMLGPILAVQIQRMVDRRRAQQDRRVGIYRTLMIERLSLSPASIGAFNAILLEFQGVGPVIAAWRAYLEHMAKSQDATWQAERVDLFFALVQKISIELGYESDFVRLKMDFYSPKRLEIVETEQEQIRSGLAALLSDKKPLPLDIRGFPADTELNGLLKKWLNQQIRPTETNPTAALPPPPPRA